MDSETQELSKETFLEVEEARGLRNLDCEGKNHRTSLFLSHCCTHTQFTNNKLNLLGKLEGQPCSWLDRDDEVGE